MILTLPVAGVGPRTITLAQFYTRLSDTLNKKIDRKFSADQKRSATQAALEACEPLGIPMTLESVVDAATRECSIPARVIALTNIEVRASFEGFNSTHTLPPSAVVLSMTPTGEALIRFRQPLSVGAHLQVQCLVHPNLPDNDSEFLAWPWTDLLEAYAIADLLSDKLYEGALIDTDQYQQMAMEWKLQADSRKLAIMQGLGIAPVDAEENTKKKRR